MRGKGTEMKPNRMGLFGGTFNPIHSGHVLAAAYVFKRMKLSKILFIPSFIPPHKAEADVAESGHRLEMVRLAVGDYPEFDVSSLEIDARGTSYSILTLEKVRKNNPRAELFFILGIDAFLEIKTWKEYERLLGQCSFVVMSRPGYHLPKAQGVLGEDFEDGLINFDNVPKDEILSTDRARIILISIPLVDVSSTTVRERLARRLKIGGMVPAAVEDYIHNNKLYQGEP